MEQVKPKIPAEAVELYNLYIHGVISRRAFMDSVNKFAIGGLAAATILDALMPNYAAAQQVSKTDDRIKATYETVQSPNGNGSIKGYLVRPVSADTRNEKPSKLPATLWYTRESRAESAYRGYRSKWLKRSLTLWRLLRTGLLHWAAFPATTTKAG